MFAPAPALRSLCSRAVRPRSGERLSMDAVIASKHPACFRSLREAGWYLGAALAHARTLLDPTRIYIGGRMAQSQGFMTGVHDGISSNSMNLSTDVAEMVVPSPRTLPKRRPDLRTAELLGALAIALHRCGDGHIERRLRRFLVSEKNTAGER